MINRRRGDADGDRRRDTKCKRKHLAGLTTSSTSRRSPSYR